MIANAVAKEGRAATISDRHFIPPRGSHESLYIRTDDNGTERFYGIRSDGKNVILEDATETRRSGHGRLAYLKGRHAHYAKVEIGLTFEYRPGRFLDGVVKEAISVSDEQAPSNLRGPYTNIVEEYSYARSIDERPKTSEPFGVRPMGLDWTPGCFVCGGEEKLYSNVSGMVESKESGARVVSMFPYGAWLDYRESEPDWIQVKIGACKEHKPNLQRLSEMSIEAGRTITAEMVAEASR